MSTTVTTSVPDGPPTDVTEPSRFRAVAVALGLVIVGFLVANVLGAVPILLEVVLTGEVLANPVYGIASVVVTMLGYAAVAFRYARTRLSIPVRTPTRRQFGLALGALVVMLALNVGSQFVVGEFGLEAAPSGIVELADGVPEVFLAFAAVALLLNGPAEELFFRGAVQGRLRTAFGVAPAVLIASALFASIHVFAVVGALGAGLVSVSIIFLVAIVLGVLYEHTNNVVVPALAHGVYNAVLFVGAYLYLVGAV